MSVYDARQSKSIFESLMLHTYKCLKRIANTHTHTHAHNHATVSEIPNAHATQDNTYTHTTERG